MRSRKLKHFCDSTNAQWTAPHHEQTRALGPGLAHTATKIVVRRIHKGFSIFTASIVALTFGACVIIAVLLHEPVPRTHDEFSYALLGETLASGHVSTPPPPVSEFFDTFHVLTRPVYASKYFPAQGIFLALGDRLTGHPAVGVWLSSALTAAATIWMLQAWIDSSWACLAAF